QFTDLSGGAAITAWLWDFGDGNTTNNTLQHPAHTYANPGLYTVSLTVTNARGSDSATRVDFITVMSPGNDSVPVAYFVASPRTGPAPLTVRFTDLSGGADITAWHWDFGDGNTTNNTLQHPAHTYANPGLYTVSLNVTNANGSNSITREHYITVISDAIITPSEKVPALNFFGLAILFGLLSLVALRRIRPHL
ncbi:MAG: PKD domain-containing protein, partial [Methanomicrobia archaeon]|nr:PKD domain-containing protein [Methanomicrobia archaeon]